MPRIPPFQVRPGDDITAERQNQSGGGVRQVDVAGGMGIEETMGGRVLITPPRQTQHTPLLAPVFVTLTQTGGNAGSKTTICDFTYTVTDLSGFEIGTDVSPAEMRTQKGKKIAATKGIGYWSGPGAFVLLWAMEEGASRGCT